MQGGGRAGRDLHAAWLSPPAAGAGGVPLLRHGDAAHSHVTVEPAHALAPHHPSASHAGSQHVPVRVEEFQIGEGVDTPSTTTTTSPSSETPHRGGEAGQSPHPNIHGQGGVGQRGQHVEVEVSTDTRRGQSPQSHGVLAAVAVTSLADDGLHETGGG